MKKRLVRAILSMVIILSMFENVISIPRNIYAESDSYGNSITKTIQSETSSGVTFQIDWLFSGGINTGATIVDNFDNNLSFISKSDGLLSSMANFTTGGNALTWTFTQSTGNTISGSILANFSKDDFDDYTNSANLSGGIYSCIDNPQHDFVTAEYTIEAPIVSPPATDLMIQKRAGNCVPPGPPPVNGIITGYRGDMIGWTCSNAKVNYNIGDYVYYTLYVHNSGTMLNSIGIADQFDKGVLQFNSVIYSGIAGSQSYSDEKNIIGWTNGFSLSSGIGTYIVLRFKVLTDEINGGSTQNKVKTRAMNGSENYNRLISNYNSIVFNSDINVLNNVDTENISITSYDLSINKSLLSGIEGGGNTVTYRLSFINNGRARDDIKVTDNFTYSGATFINRSSPLTIDSPTSLISGDTMGSISWGGIHMSTGQSSYIDMTVRLPSYIYYCTVPPTYENHASIGINAGMIASGMDLNDYNITNNNASITINQSGATMISGVCGTPNVPYDLILQSKLADKGTVTVGDKVVYTLNLYNSGIKDKRVYLQDDYTQGMVFDKILLDSSRFIKWQDSVQITNHVELMVESPNYHLDYMQKVGDLDGGALLSNPGTWIFLNSGAGDDIFNLLSGDSTGLSLCHTLYDSGSMYNTNYNDIMDIYNDLDEIYDNSILSGNSVSESIALAIASTYSALYAYKQNALDTNTRNSATIYNQAYMCYYYAHRAVATAAGYNSMDAQMYALEKAPISAGSLSNIYNLVDYNSDYYEGGKNKISGLMDILEHIGYPDINIDLSNYSSAYQTYQDIYNMFSYDDIYIDLAQGNTNVLGPINIASGESYTSGSTYNFGTSSYINFGQFINSVSCNSVGMSNNNILASINCDNNGHYTTPIYKPTTYDDTFSNILYFQKGGIGNMPSKFFYLPANQVTQFKYSMIVGNGFTSGQNINNIATIASCQDTDCTAGVYNRAGESVPGANNSASANITYHDSYINYDLSGYNQVLFINTTPPQLGSEVTYRLNYCNNGPDTASGVTIIYNYDSRLGFISASGGSIGSTIDHPLQHFLDWTSNTTLVSGGCDTIDLKFVINSISNPSNSVKSILHVGIDDGSGGYELIGDSNFTNNHVIVGFDITDNIVSSSASKIVQEHKFPFTPGSSITFDINFTGHGDNTTIIDTFDDDVLLFSGATNGGVLSGTNQVIWTNIDNNIIDKVSVTFTVKILASPGIYTNQANIDSSGQSICSDNITNVHSSITGSGIESITGDCGTVNGSIIYDFNNSGDSLTGGSANLCNTGTMSGFVYNSGTHNWDWSCEGLYSGNNVSCNASETYCGDGSTSNGEQCDDGNGVDTDACSNSCTLNTPSCSAFNFAITPAAGNVPANVTGTRDSVSGFSAVLLSWGSGILPIVNPISPLTYTYLTAGNYTGTLTLANDLSGSITVSCDISLNYTNAPIDGVCGPGDGVKVYTGTTPTGLCSVGTMSGLTQTSGGWTWSCIGANGGNDVACNADIGYCGDGSLGTGLGYTGTEQCDDGNGVDTDACSNSCTLNTPSCSAFNFATTPNGGFVGDSITRSWTLVAGFDVIAFNSGVGPDLLNPSGNMYSGAYTATGIYTGYITIQNNLSGTISQTCEKPITISDIPMSGQCGLSNLMIYYTGSTPSSLCNIGTVTGFVAGSSGWTWSCVGINGSTGTASCSADRSYCGDDIVGTGEGYNNDEQCDDGSNNGNGYCDASCQFTTPICNGLSISPTTGYVGDIYNISGSGSSWAIGQLFMTDFGTSSVSDTRSTGVVYNTTGVKDIIYTLTNPNSSSHMTQCTGSIDVTENTPVPGVCGSRWNGKQVSFLFSFTRGLCDIGVPIGFNQVINPDGSIIRTWQCNNGGALSSQCTAYKPPNSADHFDLSINKYITGSTGPYSSGNTISYQIDIYNSGGTAGSDITVYDMLPIGFELITGSIVFISGNNLVSYSGSTASGELFDVSYFENNTYISILYDVLITGSATNQTGINTASIYTLTISDEDIPYIGGVCDPADHNPISGDFAVSGTNNTDCVEVYIEPYIPPTTYTPDLVIVKSGSLIEYTSGDIIGYTISITNIGSTGEDNIVVEEAYPTGFVYGTSYTTTGVYDSGSMMRSIPYLGSGESVYLYITGVLIGTGEQINQAIITSGDCSICTGEWNSLDSGSYDLSIVKEIVPPSMVSSGAQVSYIITYYNYNLTGMYITIEDNYDIHHIYLTGYISGLNMSPTTVDTGSRLVTWSGVWLDAMTTGIINITFQVVGQSGDIFANTGRIGTHSGRSLTRDQETDRDNNVDDATGAISPIPPTTYTPDLVIVKSGSLIEYASGDIIGYTISITNIGSTGEDNIVVEEAYPTGFVYGTSYTTTGVYDSGSMMRSIPYLGSGESVYLYITGVLIGTGEQINQAIITSGDCSICTGEWTSDPSPSTGLDLTKSVDRPVANSGDIVTRTLLYTNTSSIVCTDMKVLDYLPDNFVYGGATMSGIGMTGVVGYAPRSYTYSIGSLLPGQTGSITITGTVRGSSGDMITNTGVIYSDGSCSGLQDTGTAETTITNYWNIKVTKSVDRPSVYVGDDVTRTIYYGNDTYLTAYDVILQDTLPAGVQYISANITPSTILNNQLTRNIGTLIPGQTGSINITTKALSIGTHTNSVIISSTGEVYTGDNQDSATVTVNCKNCGGGRSGGPHVEGDPEPDPPSPPKKKILDIRDYIENIINIVPTKIIPKTGADR